MKLSDVINQQWIDPNLHSGTYNSANPFPHIIMHNFLNKELLKRVADEFPDLAQQIDGSVVKYEDSRQIKLQGIGMGVLSPAALHITSYLQSDLFLGWLNSLTGIKELLISDPYLAGGGYHEIKSGGLLKVHADFNKHSQLDLDRRLNLLIYLNEDWDDSWNGALQLFDENMDTAIQTVMPKFNTAVLFTTTSFTYHGHPDSLMCPPDRSRKSLAYYYYSSGRPKGEVSKEKHTTLFKKRKGESFGNDYSMKSLVIDVTPPIVIKLYRRILKICYALERGN